MCICVCLAVSGGARAYVCALCVCVCVSVIACAVEVLSQCQCSTSAGTCAGTGTKQVPTLHSATVAPSLDHFGCASRAQPRLQRGSAVSCPLPFLPTQNLRPPSAPPCESREKTPYLASPPQPRLLPWLGWAGLGWLAGWLARPGPRPRPHSRPRWLALNHSPIVKRLPALSPTSSLSPIQISHTNLLPA